MMKYRNVVVQPVVTEKTLAKTGEGEYAFLVERSVSKNQIKEAVENLFGVSVTNVRTANLPARKVRVNRRTWRKKAMPTPKRAVVKLAEGQKIALFEEEK